MKNVRKTLLIVVIGIVLLACSTLGLSRDESGALLVETSLPLSLLESTIENSVDLSQLEDLQMELQEGYILFTAAAINFEGIVFEDISFHLELGVVDGQLAAKMTNVSVAGSTIDDNVFEPVNQMIAERLAESQEQVEQADLVDVRTSPEGITLVWRMNRANEN